MKQCCGTGTGTAGTVTFCPSGTGTGVVEPKQQELQLFALVKLGPECITVAVLEPDLDPDPTKNGIKKVKKSKVRGHLSKK